MAATFNPALSSPRDVARQRVGDTDVNDAQFPDETYDAMLAAAGSSPITVAAQICRDIAAKYARKTDWSADNQSQKGSALIDHYLKLADKLDADARLATAQSAVAGFAAEVVGLGGGVYVGGTSAREVYAARADPDAPENVRRW